MTINPTTLTVTEGDATGNSYTVVLASQPAGDVTVTISGHAGTDLTVSGTTLTNNVLTFTIGELEHGPDGEGESRRGGRRRHDGRRRDPGP